MPTTMRVTEIVRKVRNRLGDGEKEGVHLKVVNQKLER